MFGFSAASLRTVPALARHHYPDDEGTSVQVRDQATKRQRPGVLLVDDHASMLEQLAELLPLYGIHVVGSLDRGDRVVAAIAAAAAARDPVDVIVMDVRMPGVDGLQATRNVTGAFPYVKVILHTAFAGQLGEATAATGAFAEVAKGATPDVLVDTIRAAWQAQREAAHARA